MVDAAARLSSTLRLGSTELAEVQRRLASWQIALRSMRSLCAGHGRKEALSRRQPKTDRSHADAVTSMAGSSPIDSKAKSPIELMPAQLTPPAPPAKSNIRKILGPALVAAGIWWIVLAILAALTANPVTLNRKQILSSQYVVTAVVKDAAAGRITVEKEWKTGANIGGRAIGGLEGTGARAGDRYIIPLTVTAEGGLTVTMAPPPLSRPLVYPADADALEQLEDAIRN